MAEVKSSRASKALRTHFEALGLEAYKPSKMSYPRLEDSTFFVSLKMSHGYDLFLLYLGNRQKPRGKYGNFFFWRSPEKNFGELFWGGEYLRLMYLALVSRSRSLALASDFFVSLASKVAYSTPPLQNSETRFGHLFYYL